jgi:HEPN domain-containing protein
MPREIAKEWIAKADEDFRYAMVGLEHSDLFALVCFHFQQAAIEKALPVERSIGEDCAFINPFYIDTRYPVHWPANYDRSTAEAARDATERIRSWVIALLPG